MADNDLSLWMLREANGGWFIVSAGTVGLASEGQGIQLYSGCYTTCPFKGTGYFIFNFYEPEAE